jgi:hypothetical protein
MEKEDLDEMKRNLDLAVKAVLWDIRNWRETIKKGGGNPDDALLDASKSSVVAAYLLWLSPEKLESSSRRIEYLGFLVLIFAAVSALGSRNLKDSLGGRGDRLMVSPR